MKKMILFLLGAALAVGAATNDAWRAQMIRCAKAAPVARWGMVTNLTIAPTNTMQTNEVLRWRALTLQELNKPALAATELAKITMATASNKVLSEILVLRGQKLQALAILTNQLYTATNLPTVRMRAAAMICDIAANDTYKRQAVTTLRAKVNPQLIEVATNALTQIKITEPMLRDAERVFEVFEAAVVSRQVSLAQAAEVLKIMRFNIDKESPKCRKMMGRILLLLDQRTEVQNGMKALGWRTTEQNATYGASDWADALSVTNEPLPGSLYGVLLREHPYDLAYRQQWKERLTAK